MTTYTAHFWLGHGVTLKLERDHEGKHYPISTLDDACEALAKRLGAAFLYYEETSP
jgi:hypothetical protein